MRLKDKVALITGAGGGIGKAIAMRFAQEEAIVAINDINQTKGETTAYEICQKGGQAKFFPADVSNSTEVENMVDSVLASFHKIDVLVNNAGIIHFQRLVDLSDEMWDRVLRINLYGAFYCTRAVLQRSMMPRKEGSIIFMASVAPYVGGPMVASYSASKGGVVGLMRAVAKEVAFLGIRANAIAPGYIITE